MFRFPIELKTQKIWIQKCKRGDKFNPKTSYVCSKHFTADNFVRNMKSEFLG